MNASTEINVRADHREALSAVDNDYLQRLFREFREQDGAAIAYYGDYCLRSVYQPIFGLAHRRAVGYEALLRARHADGTAIAPLQLFDTPQSDDDVVLLDRICRALHTYNFRSLADGNTWLFLNVNPKVVVKGRHYGAVFAELLRRHALVPGQVVVEVLEDALHDEGLLAEAVHYYRDLGCLVAIDDFGAGHSNFDRIMRLAPHMVKLDRKFITQAQQSRAARRMLPNLISLLHEAGCLVVLEGVETETEALIALEADADFVQGFYFARPEPAHAQPAHNPILFTSLGRLARDNMATARVQRELHLRDYVMAFEQCAARYTAGDTFETAARPLTALNDTIRCYVLDANGVQVGSNINSAHLATVRDPRFTPLHDTAGCDWSGRPYFRRAVGDPGTIQFTRPYLSVTGAHLTVTLSMAVRRRHRLHVLCCDLRQPEQAY